MKSELLGCGAASDGQLGMRGCSKSVNVPDRIIGAPSDTNGSSVVSVACGDKHTVFLAEDGKMWSVGCNEDGQLGRGSKNEGSFSIYPVTLSCGVGIIQEVLYPNDGVELRVAAGRAHSLAVAEDGRLFSWGSNQQGQLAMTSSVRWQESPKRIPSITECIQVAAGQNHCIALIENGRVLVWGEQHDGMCLHSPKEVSEFIGVPIVRVVAGGRHCVAITASGNVFTWGQNDHGQLGVGDHLPRGRPICVEHLGGLRVVEAACGDQHTVLLTSDGRLFVFGSDVYGQCGLGTKLAKRTHPMAVEDLIGSCVSRVATGRCHTVAVVGGFVYPFGLNTNGQLGNGSSRSNLIPRKTDELDHVKSVFAGHEQTFFMRSSHLDATTPGPNNPIRKSKTICREAVDELLKSGDKFELVGLLETVFSSMSVLNASFLWNDERRFNVGHDRDSGLNMDEVMETFNLLAENLASSRYSEVIMQSFEIGLGEMDMAKCASVECLRFLLILPWLSDFTQNVKRSTVETLHQPFVKAILKLDQKYTETLDKWWSRLPKRHFNRVVAGMTSAVKALVKEKAKTETAGNFMLVLERLNNINNKMNIIPLESFYVDDLAVNYDIKLDYFNWVVNDFKKTTRYWSSFPFIMNALAKGELLQVEAYITQRIRLQNLQLLITPNGMILPEIPVLELSVRRDHIVSDTMVLFSQMTSSDLQKPLKVQFYNEEGSDAGGVKKEFFLLVMQKILQEEYGMFSENPESHLVWFSGFPFCEYEYFVQLGKLCGLAVYNHVIVPFPFPLALYKLILNQHATIDDLCELSPTEGKSLQSLLDYEGDEFEATFLLDFTIVFDVLGEKSVIELKPDGANVPVTLENRTEYVNLYVRHRLELGPEKEIKKQAESFRQGFIDALHSRFLGFFQPRELMELVVGNENYDWTEFRKVVQYKGEYHANHPTILAFWDAFFRLSTDERKQFLQFLCGSTRLPVAGMSALQVFIQPTTPEILPVAHTCFNLLDLPSITDADELLRRLRISITCTQGFQFA